MVKNTGFIEKASLLFNASLDDSISIILEKNLGVKDNEALLIAFDKNHESLARNFKSQAELHGLNKVDLLLISGLKVNGQEPTPKVAKEFLKYDVIIILTDRSLSHTKARRDATKKGIRIASMPGVTKSIIRRSIDIDYDLLKKDSKKLADYLSKAKDCRITTKYGTDISFSLKGRKAHGTSAGIYDKKSKWGNLPEGEAFIAPVEGTANGHFVVDGSIAGFGKIRHPVVFFVKDGFVTKITNGKKPAEVDKLLSRYGKLAKNIAEFGVGLNRKAKVTGIVLEDEKVYGTCHIALGNNIGFGGKTDVPIHIDCVMMRPNIHLDGKLVMRSGKLLV